VVDWGAGHLGPNTIAASQWAIAPQHDEGLVVYAATREDRLTSITLTGGRAGHVYDVTNRVTLSNGEIDERSISLRVEQR
jgi:hypothetical protein